MAKQRLRFAQKFVAEELSNPKYVEDYRQRAWYERKVFLVDHPPEYREGGWPDGLTAESYVRGLNGLNAEGTALVGEPDPEPEKPKPLSPWLEAEINRAKAGRS